MKKTARTPKQSKTNILKNTIFSKYPDLTDAQLEYVTQELIFAPKERMINIYGEETSASDMRFQTATTIESKKSKKTNDAYDANLNMAQSIESLNSETSSSHEYFTWLNLTSEIIKNMNDGFVTKADLEQKNTFLDMSYQRETELLLCLSLYQNSNHPQAAEFARMIRYKLNKLREMRSAIQNTTGNEADTPVSEDEYKRALPYYKTIKTMEQMPFGYELSPQQKRMLGIDQPEDQNEGCLVYENITNALLDEIIKNNEELIALTSGGGNSGQDNSTEIKNFDNVNKRLTEEEKEQLKEIQARIEALRGNYRKNTFAASLKNLEQNKNLG